MPDLKPEKPKTEALRRQRALNLHPERVTDPLFQQNEFYDPHDLVQVKYEMLRQVQVDKVPINQSAAAFGFSRPTFYQTQLDFERQGLFGLVQEKGAAEESQAHARSLGLCSSRTSERIILVSR